MRILTTFFICCAFIINSFAQEKEAGIFVGATAFQGDLVEKSIDFNEFNLGFGAFYRFYTSPKMSFRAGINAGIFTSDDANATESYRIERGYSSKSSIIDATVIAEWNILGINIYGSTGYNQNRFSPYLLFGVGASVYNPTVTTSNTELRPLDAEKEYAAFSMVIPVGFGLKYATEKVTLSVEGSVRAGLTDYLDGISKSGNPDNNDWYGYYGVSAAYRLGEVKKEQTMPTSETPKSMDEFQGSEEDSNSGM